MSDLIRNFLKNKWGWRSINRSIGSISRTFTKIEKFKNFDSAEWHRFHTLCDKIFASKTVLHGPFKGMKYPHMDSVESGLYPKLLGCYEKELEAQITYILEQRYAAIIDIGCAEGYYAVGFAMRCQDAEVYAFDIDQHARSLCEQMARLNGVQVHLGGLCNQDTLLNMSLKGRSLILADCEGYEVELFTRDLVRQLKGHDFLIETHDFKNIVITGELLKAFHDTHECEVIESIDDIIKAYDYEYDEIASLPLADRRQLVGEGRPQIMRWIFAKSKSPNG